MKTRHVWGTFSSCESHTRAALVHKYKDIHKPHVRTRNKCPGSTQRWRRVEDSKPGLLCWHIVNKVLEFKVGRNSHPHTCIYWVTGTLFTLSPPPISPHCWLLAVLFGDKQLNRSVFPSKDGKYLCMQSPYSSFSVKLCCLAKPQKPWRWTVELLQKESSLCHGSVKRATALKVRLIAPTPSEAKPLLA